MLKEDFEIPVINCLFFHCKALTVDENHVEYIKNPFLSVK